MNILVVEDDPYLLEGIVEILESEKHHVTKCKDGEKAIQLANQNKFDAMLLDILIPKINGIDVVKALRNVRNSIPIIIISALSDANDRVKGLDAGADDYLPKPFCKAELLARLRAATRRSGEIKQDLMSYHGTSLDLDKFQLVCGDEHVRVSMKEMKILQTFFLNPNVLFSKDRLIEKVWDYDSNIEYNSVEVYISFLRNKLAAIHATVKIKTARGVGYMLVAKDSNDDETQTITVSDAKRKA